MATRGTPIPFTTRMEVQRLRIDEEKIADIARLLKLSRPTVYKYSRKGPGQ